MKPYIVVGAGFGGLTAAMRLRAMGHPVLVVEANEQAGGRGSVWKKDGYTFDAGPTVITAPYLFDELFIGLKRDPRDYYEMIPTDPFYRVAFQDGTTFDYVGDDDRLLSQIQAMSPGDVDGYRGLVKEAQAIFDVGYSQLADKPFDRLTDMLRIVPDMLKLGSWRTVHGMVAKYIKDERLQQVLTFEPLLIGGNPFTAPSIYLLIHWLERKWGVHFPRGGTGALVSAMVRALSETGVDVRLNAPVERIEVTNGQATAVILEGGERIEAQGVVCNGDPSFVYKNLIDKAHRRTNTDRAVDRVRQSPSLFVTYFGSDQPAPQLAHHTILLGPRYKGLLDDIFHKRVLADDFSLYLHAPTRTDPNLAPPGHEAFYVLSPIPNALSGVDWEKHQAEYEDRILAEVERRLLPGLRSHITTKFSLDTRYFEGRLRSVHGAAFGPEPRLEQSAWLRYHNRSEDVGGLYFVGAGTHPGAGVPGVLNSAKVLERLVERPAVPLAITSRMRAA